MTFTLSVLAPIVIMIAVAILLPRLLVRWLPETGRGLVVNFLLCAVLLSILCGLYFFASYSMQNTRLLDLIGFAPGATFLYFLRLGVASALIWGPVLVLAMASVPKLWKEATW